MTFGPGWLLAARDEREEDGLWFIFHHGPEGSLGINLTQKHPNISYAHFEAALDFEAASNENEKVVLAGGPAQPDNGLVILHEAHMATPESHIINEDFSFLSYTYVLLPGQPPVITTPENRPTRIALQPQGAFLVAMGYRSWDAGALETEMAAGRWICLPASPDIVFFTDRRKRREKATRQVN